MCTTDIAALGVPLTDASTNCDNSPVCAESTSGCRGTTTTPATRRQLSSANAVSNDTAPTFANGCAPGLHHIFCQKCLPRDDGKLSYYLPATASSVASCEACSQTALLVVAILVGAALVVLLLVLGAPQ